MSTLQRLGWLLLGLLVLAGAMHAPLHEDEQDCGPFALCSAGVVLMLAAAIIGLMQLLELAALPQMRALGVPRRPALERACGRAPPRKGQR